MHTRFSKTLAAAALAMATAPAAAAPAAPDCGALAGRADGLAHAPAGGSLADLSIAIAPGQREQLALTDARLLAGPCAGAVQAFQMSLLVFGDGAVFAAAPDGRIAPAPALNPAALGIHAAADAHPALAQGRFLMASRVGVVAAAGGRRTLDVGLWQTDDGYVVAAYTGRAGGFGAPVELLRSTRALRSVTYFPAPDTNAGTLGIVMEGGDGVALVSLGWHHDALSRALALAVEE